MKTEIIACVNQKGGVGKSTTCINLGVGLAQEGRKVLLLDADAQASMTIGLSMRAAARAYFMKSPLKFCSEILFPLEHTSRAIGSVRSSQDF